MEMKVATKAIYINCAILVGLLLELYWGRPAYIVGIAAVILLVVANVVLFLVSRRTHRA